MNKEKNLKILIFIAIILLMASIASAQSSFCTVTHSDALVCKDVEAPLNNTDGWSTVGATSALTVQSGGLDGSYGNFSYDFRTANNGAGGFIYNITNESITNGQLNWTIYWRQETGFVDQSNINFFLTNSTRGDGLDEHEVGLTFPDGSGTGSVNIQNGSAIAYDSGFDYAINQNYKLTLYLDLDLSTAELYWDNNLLFSGDVLAPAQIKYLKIIDFASNDRIDAELDNMTVYYTPNTPPTSFELSTPTNTATLTNNTVTFTWGTSTDPENESITYTLNIYNNTGDLIVSVAGLNTTSSTQDLSTYLDGFNPTNFTWNVTSSDGVFSTPSDSTYLFTIDLEATPSSFDLTSPPNGKTLTSPTSVSFSWGTSTDGDGDTVEYELKLYDNSATLLETTNTTETTTNLDLSSYVTGLEAVTFLWNVTSGDGTTTVNSDSTFTFDIDLPFDYSSSDIASSILDTIVKISIGIGALAVFLGMWIVFNILTGKPPLGKNKVFT